MKPIFAYTDYRLYLRDYYREKKAAEKFTYRKFAEMTGVNSSSWLLLLIKGQKRLSTDSAVRISRALGHTEEETEYFENLVYFNQAKNTETKNYYFKKITDKRKRLNREHRLKIALLTEDQYEYYGTWYNPVIRSLVNKIDFRDNYALLARQLIPSITASQARKSIALLKRLNLIERDGEGRWRQRDAVISSGDDVDRLNVINYHKQTNDIAGKIFDNCTREQRDVSSLTMGITEKDFELIKENIEQFRAHIMKIAKESNDAEADRVYQLNVQLFPMAIVKKEKKGA